MLNDARFSQLAFAINKMFQALAVDVGSSLAAFYRDGERGIVKMEVLGLPRCLLIDGESLLNLYTFDLYYGSYWGSLRLVDFKDGDLPSFDIQSSWETLFDARPEYQANLVPSILQCKTNIGPLYHFGATYLGLDDNILNVACGRASVLARAIEDVLWPTSICIFGNNADGSCECTPADGAIRLVYIYPKPEVPAKIFGNWCHPKDRFFVKSISQQLQGAGIDTTYEIYDRKADAYLPEAPIIWRIPLIKDQILKGYITQSLDFS